MSIHTFILARPGEDHFVVRTMANSLERQTGRTLISAYAINGTVYGVFRGDQDDIPPPYKQTQNKKAKRKLPPIPLSEKGFELSETTVEEFLEELQEAGDPKDVFGRKIIKPTDNSWLDFLRNKFNTGGILPDPPDLDTRRIG